ncbi:branched-chain amino acid ABC transporter permease [Natrarchaeobius oligotrophus]|uniref:Branched-chain amino acid ABC transporter permease n=1 Tax=Natrarchaeobius chitinivorans TaxID=1679083 RepID=A0A3N6PKR4_NATCH|nr:branched-chain amino acid ABC transporter permease [Natrarchaeobius chitinivorans]RQG99405.1 branched-chain amino acid ABC transporter permease [Natrarchaeobius chitinivorans]
MSEETAQQLTDTDAAILSWETWDRVKHTERFAIVAAVVFVALWSWLFARAPITSELGGYHSLATTILIWSVFAIGFNLLLGQTGLLSFGHAMFWGGGGYAAALVSLHVYGDPVLMLVVGTTFTLLLAALTGVIALRLHAVYFAIITLAMGQLLYYLATSPLRPITGGRNGLTGIQLEPIFGLVYLGMPLPGIFGTLWVNYEYLLVATVFVLVIAFVNRIRKSPYGLIFRAIRENEQRVSFVGLNVWRYKFAAFLMSGGIVGLGGSLMTIESQFAGLGSLYWITSGEVVIMTVLGGVGTLFGPVLGAVIFLYFEGVVDGFPIVGRYWLLMLATVFTAIVWKYPDGLWGMLKLIASRIRSSVEDNP